MLPDEKTEWILMTTCSYFLLYGTVVFLGSNYSQMNMPGEWVFQLYLYNQHCVQVAISHWIILKTIILLHFLIPIMPDTPHHTDQRISGAAEARGLFLIRELAFCNERKLFICFCYPIRRIYEMGQSKKLSLPVDCNMTTCSQW